MELYQAGGPQALQRRLLIVDDEPKICHVLREYFSRRAYDVRSVCSGEEALALISAFRPDVVLLDLLMPGISGIDTLNL